MNPKHQKLLLHTARQSIAHGLQHKSPLSLNVNDYPDELRQKRATFVTLKIHGRLRGCIGTLEAKRALIEDVAHNAFLSAFSDRRFSPLREDELRELKISISVLSPAEVVAFTSRGDLIQKIRPGVDGLILEEGPQRGTFLPSVWETISGPDEFLSHLLQKAGLSPDYWSDTITIKRYTTETFGEP